MAGPKSATGQLAQVASEVLNKPPLQSGPTSSQVCYWVGLLLAAVICGLLVEVQSSSHASSVETVMWWQAIASDSINMGPSGIWQVVLRCCLVTAAVSRFMAGAQLTLSSR